MGHEIGINKALGGSTNAPDWYKEFDQGQVLLPYQSKWIADDAVIKIAEKSRRTGLTWAEAADATLCAGASKSAGGCNHFYVGSNKEMAREFIDAVAMWARAFNQVAEEVYEELLEDEDKDILTFVVRFASGFKVQALSSKPSNLRGMQGNVTIDEAAFHDNLAELLKAALALTMWGSKVRIISTHNGAENKFNELIQEARAGKKRYSIHSIPLAKAVAQGLYKRICQITRQEWTPEKEKDWVANLYKDTDTVEDAEEEYGCVPKAGGGAYLSRALIESRMTLNGPVLRYNGTADFNSWPEPTRYKEIEDWCHENLLPLLEKLNPVLRHAFGEDFARTGDLTVMVPMAVEPNLVRTVPFIVELKNVPHKQQEQILKFICDRLPRFCKGKLDARGNGSYLAEAAKDEYGAMKIDEVMISQDFYLQNMPKMKAAFEDATIALVKDDEVASDLRAIQVIKGIPKIPEGNTNDTNKKKHRHGDAAVALCLAYAASFEDGGEIDWTPAPTGKSQWDDPDQNSDFKMYKSGAW